MDKYIEQFITKYQNRIGFNSYIENCFTTNLSEYYKTHNNTIYYNVIQKEKQQKELHSLFKIEIDKLFNYAINNDINLLGLKGFFLESQCWEKTRFYNDIDILLSIDDIEKLKQFFLDEEYQLINNRKYFTKKKYIPLNKITNINLIKTHHIVLRKTLPSAYSNHENVIELELHGNINSLKLSNFNNNKLLNEKLIYKNYYILSNENQLLYLCYHTIQHLPYIRHNISNFYVKLDCFVDVANLINKEQINWQQVITNAIEYKIVPICSLFFKMFTEIYYDLIPEYVIILFNNLSNTETFKWKNIYKKLMTIDSYNLICGNFNDFIILKKEFSKITKVFGDNLENTYVKKIAMEIWKLKLKKINLITKSQKKKD